MEKIRTSSSLTRCSMNFIKEMKEIQENREKLGFEKLSIREQTNLITRHSYWPLLKKDLINFDPLGGNK